MFTVFTEFDSIYKRLGVTLIERGESFYQPIMSDIVADLESKSLSTRVCHDMFNNVNNYHLFRPGDR